MKTKRFFCDKCVKNDEVCLTYDDSTKLKAWKSRYEILLNVEFVWNSDSLRELEPKIGPPLYITEKTISKAIPKMKTGKAAGPSGIVIEMIRSAGKEIIKSITNLANRIIKEGSIPSDWKLSYIVSSYKGKGDALSRDNYRGLKMLDQVIKIIERVLDSVIRSQVDIDSMQFGFMLGRGTTDAIFILRQLQENHLGKQKPLYFAFVDLEKSLDRVPRKVLWWAMRRVGVEKWVIRAVKAMYENAKSRVCLNGQFSDELNIKVGVLSPLLFIIFMETLLREFKVGCPWELIYAEDLVLMAETLEDLKKKRTIWKDNIEAKGLRVNVNKTKLACSKHNLSDKSDPVKWPCSICRKGVGSISIFYQSCSHWVHERCSKIKGRLKADPSFKCNACTNNITISPYDPEVIVGNDKFEVVDPFRYLGDSIGQSGSCIEGTTDSETGLEECPQFAFSTDK